MKKPVARRHTANSNSTTKEIKALRLNCDGNDRLQMS